MPEIDRAPAHRSALHALFVGPGPAGLDSHARNGFGARDGGFHAPVDLGLCGSSRGGICLGAQRHGEPVLHNFALGRLG